MVKSAAQTPNQVNKCYLKSLKQKAVFRLVKYSNKFEKQYSLMKQRRSEYNVSPANDKKEDYRAQRAA